MATGPDGTLWNLTPTGGRFGHVTPQGTLSYTDTHVPKCENRGEPSFIGMERAADGAMWIIDQGCERLLRVTAAGTSVVALGGDVDAIAPDAAGGIWFAASSPSQDVGHVDAAGTVKRFELGDNALARDIAVAPVAREHRAARAPRVRSAVRAVRLDRAHRAHHAGRELRQVSLKALRRGLRISVREAAVVEVAGYAYADDDGDVLPGTHDVERVLAKAGSFRYRLPASVLRKLAAGRSPMLELVISARDAEGVQSGIQSTLRVTR